MQGHAETLSPRQAAVRLGIRLDALYSLLWAGKLTGNKHNGRWMIPVSAVTERLKARKASDGTAGR